jgi:hypothetical protein
MTAQQAVAWMGTMEHLRVICGWHLRKVLLLL